MSSARPLCQMSHAAWHERCTACVLTPKAPGGMAVAAASRVTGAPGAQRMLSVKCSLSTDRRRGELGGRPATRARSAKSTDSSRAVASGGAATERRDDAAWISAPFWVVSEWQGDPGGEAPTA